MVHLAVLRSSGFFLRDHLGYWESNLSRLHVRQVAYPLYITSALHFLFFIFVIFEIYCGLGNMPHVYDFGV